MQELPAELEKEFNNEFPSVVNVVGYDQYEHIENEVKAFAAKCYEAGRIKDMEELPAELNWRLNLHKLVKLGVYGPKYNGGIATVIVDAIDAAYVQGLEDGKRQGAREKNKEWREGRRVLSNDTEDIKT